MASVCVSQRFLGLTENPFFPKGTTAMGDEELPKNCTLNWTEALPIDYPSEDFSVKIGVPITFAVIFIVGLVGNGTLVYIVLKNKSMRTKPNVLIVSLAIGDFLLILVSVPFTSTMYTFQEWNYGTVVCKLNEFMQTVSLGVSVFTLAALSADRFLAIVYPFTAYCSVTMTKVRTIAVSIWAVAVLMGLVDLVGADVRPCCSSQINVCDLYPPEWGDNYEAFRRVFRFLVYFLFPVVVITTLYSVIACVLYRKPYDGSQRHSGTGATSAISRRIESRKRVAKVVLSFVVIFVVCWLPRQFYALWYYYAEFEYSTAWHFFKIVGFCLCFIYSSINPFALYFLNDEFRHYFRYYLFRRCNPKWRLPPTTSRMNSVQSSTVRYSVV